MLEKKKKRKKEKEKKAGGDSRVYRKWHRTSFD
jgi:hypothetical protein